jgi:uncharacterized caspase-like protein
MSIHLEGGRDLRVITIVSAALAGVALAVWSAGADAANPRIALVIGEAAYPDATLPTAANDAGLVAQVLQAAGFDVVGARDLDQKSVRESLRDFLDKANAAGPDMQAFVYISGRALQYSGDNYLAPVDARIVRDSDVPIEAVKITDFTHALAAAPGLARVVVIDGARPNPYAQQGQPLAGGLALVDPEPGSVIAFNAAPGAIGVQDAGDYGVYAKSLAGLMRQGGVDVTQVLAQVRVDVNQKTQGAQLPWSAGKLTSPYFLFERAADAPPVVIKAPARKPLKQLPPAEAYEAVIQSDRLEDYEEFLRDHARSEQARRIEAIVAARREAMFWRRTLEQNSPRAYWTYLRRYPKGPHAYDADRRLGAIRAELTPPPDFEALEYDDLPPPPPAEIVYADRPVYYFGGDDFGPPPPPPPRDYVYDDDEDSGWRDLPPPPRPTVAGMLPALAIAIPLGLAARAYYDRPRPDGRAPAAAAPPPPRPLGPPPLPRGVKVTERQETAAPRPPAPGAKGQVKFVAPPPPAAAGGRPPAPAVAPAAATSPAGVEAAPAAKRSPGALPTPTPGATAEPTPHAGRSPLPTPSATALPTPGATAEPTPHARRTPLPTPGAGATPTPGATAEPTPHAGRSPLPTPSGTGAPEGKAHVRPTPERSSTPEPGTVEAKPSLKTSEPRPAVETPKTPPKSAPEQPKPKAEVPRAVETPRPVRTVEPMKPAPHVESPKPAPVVEHRAEPKPAPVVEHRAEPKPAPVAERRAEPPKPAAAEARHPEPEGRRPEPAKPVVHEANCGHPGQPHC